jgi:thioredoxin 1
MGNAIAFTKESFKTATAEGVSLVDFWAEWCGPCKMIAPAIEELAKEFEGKAHIGKVDVDQEGELAQEFGVSSIPTLLIMKNGAEAQRFVGVTKKEELAKAINAALG